jgi:hypothetical protein
MTVVVELIVLYSILAVVVASIVMCALKGKWGMLFGGFFIHPLWFVGAIRLAKPKSWWARKRYGSEKFGRAVQRVAS